MDLSETDSSSPTHLPQEKPSSFSPREEARHLPPPSPAPEVPPTECHHSTSPNGNTPVILPGPGGSPCCEHCPRKYGRLLSTDSSDSSNRNLGGASDPAVRKRAPHPPPPAFSVEETLQILNNNEVDLQWEAIERVLSDKNAQHLHPHQRPTRYKIPLLGGGLPPTAGEEEQRQFHHHSFFVTKALEASRATRRAAQMTNSQSSHEEDGGPRPWVEDVVNCNSDRMASSEVESNHESEDRDDDDDDEDEEEEEEDEDEEVDEEEVEEDEDDDEEEEEREGDDEEDEASFDESCPAIVRRR